MPSTDKIILKSSDGESFEMEKAVALQIDTIRQRNEEMGAPAEGILLPNVTGKILSKVIEYCKMHVVDTNRDSSVAGDDLKGWDAEVDRANLLDLSRDFSKLIALAWDAEFVKVDQATLLDLIRAAHDLNIKGLLDLACLAQAGKIKMLPPEEIRKSFSSKNEFTPAEEEEVPRENRWAFE